MMFKRSQRFLIEFSSKLTAKFLELKTLRPSVPRLKYIRDDAFGSQTFHGLSPHSIPTVSRRRQ